MQMDAPPKPEGSLRRKLLRLTLAFLLIAGMGILLLHVLGQSALNTQIAAVRASGDPLIYQEIEARRSALLDEENGALVLTALFEQLSPLSRAGPLTRKQVPLLGAGEFPPLGESVQQETLEAVRGLLAEYADAIEEIRRLKDMPRGRFPLSIPKNPLDEMDMASRPYRHVRAACKLMALDAFVNACDGRGDGAASSILIMLNVANTLSQDPALLSTLTSAACEALAADTLQRCLSLTVCSSDTLEAVGEALKQCEGSDALVWGMWGERAQITAVFEHVRRGGVTSGPGVKLPPYAAGWLTGGWNKLDQAKALSLLNQAVAFSKEGARGLRKPTGEPFSGTSIDSAVEGTSKFYLMTRILMPSFGRVQVLWGKRTAELRCARAGVALERFRLANGRWPESLENLVPAYLHRVLHDPFSGQPLRFAIDQQGVIVYSVDENGIDDGGVIESPNGARAPDVGFRLLNPELRLYKQVEHRRRRP